MEELRPHESQNVEDVRKLLGLLGYYCCYVENFSRITKPIYDLLKPNAVSTKSDMSHLNPAKRKQSNKFQVPSKTPVVWEEKHKQALNVLIDCLTSPPVMAYPDFSQPFILHADASEEGLGSALYQKLDGKMRVIGYAPPGGTLNVEIIGMLVGIFFGKPQKIPRF